jgi:SSS family transporter
MRPLDWIVVFTYLVWIVYDGLKRSKATDRVEGYFLANRTLPWWAVGLSVMATQLSAITLVGTTGQGFADGLRFVQFYFGLPLAMVILSVTVVPFFHRARVYTAYEYLERRFDVKVRTLASALFLCSRGLSCGVIVAAPAVILSIVLEWNLTLTILAIGAPTVLYTMIGGVQAVTWTDVKQMVIITAAVAAAVVVLALDLPVGVSVPEALGLAGMTGRMQTLDFRFDLDQTYTFWSGLVGGLFLMLSYFGCDQSQVQRYLTARSVDEGRDSLMMSAYAKIPLQALILLTGVLVYAVYLFQPPPMVFNPVHERRVRASGRAAEYAGLEQAFARTVEQRRQLAAALADDRLAGEALAGSGARQAFVESDREIRRIREQAFVLIRDVTGDARFREDGERNYVFPTFIVTRMPIGLVGLMIAAIFAAAMSSIAAELNSLATSTVIDFYRRLARPEASDRHYLVVSKVATGLWGVFACVVAAYSAQLGSLIEVVNRFGSFFYGTLLGVFVLAIGTRRATANGAFAGLIGGLAAVTVVALTTNISFLWHNVVGCVGAVALGLAVSAVDRGRP